MEARRATTDESSAAPPRRARADRAALDKNPRAAPALRSESNRGFFCDALGPVLGFPLHAHIEAVAAANGADRRVARDRDARECLLPARVRRGFVALARIQKSSRDALEPP